MSRTITYPSPLLLLKTSLEAMIDIFPGGCNRSAESQTIDDFIGNGGAEEVEVITHFLERVGQSFWSLRTADDESPFIVAVKNGRRAWVIALVRVASGDGIPGARELQRALEMSEDQVIKEAINERLRNRIHEADIGLRPEEHRPEEEDVSDDGNQSNNAAENAQGQVPLFEQLSEEDVSGHSSEYSDTSNRGRANTSNRGRADTSNRGRADTSNRGRADTNNRGRADTNNRGRADTSNRGRADRRSNNRLEPTPEKIFDFCWKLSQRKTNELNRLWSYITHQLSNYEFQIYLEDTRLIKQCTRLLQGPRCILVLVYLKSRGVEFDVCDAAHAFLAGNGLAFCYMMSLTEEAPLAEWPHDSLLVLPKEGMFLMNLYLSRTTRRSWFTFTFPLKYKKVFQHIQREPDISPSFSSMLLGGKLRVTSRETRLDYYSSYHLSAST